MDKRRAVRYSSDLLADGMSEVIVLWSGNAPIEADVVNYCAQGIRVIIPYQQVTCKIPKKSKTIMVKMRVAKIWFAGKCVSATSHQDGSVSIGIYFYDPGEQKYLGDLLCKKLNDCDQSGSLVSYERNECSLL